MAEKRTVKCNGCGNEWESQAKPKNLKCKKCGGTDIQESIAPKVTPPIPEKSKEQLEHEADVARRVAVDAKNNKDATEKALEEDRLANIPLNDEEKAFIAEIEPKMNEGRKIMRPSPADILRYSQLIKRKDVKG